MKLNTKPLAGIEIGIPVIVEGTYHARIDKAEVKPRKDNLGNNLAVQFRILDPVVVLNKDGSQVENKGQIVNTRHFSLVPTDNYDPDKGMKELAVAIKHPEDADLEPEHLNDKIVMVKMEVRQEEKDPKSGRTYPLCNEIRRVTPLPEGDTFTAPPF